MSSLKYAEWGVFVILFVFGWGLWRQRRGRSTAWRLQCGAWAALLLLCWPPFATLAVATLEWQSPQRPAANPGAQTMVVLSGGIVTTDPAEPGVAPAFGTLQRCLHAAWLYRNGWKMPVVVTGGVAHGNLTYAAVMEDVLRKEGLPAGDIWKEEQAQSTYDSARLLAGILQPRGVRKILLVTEAYHMPRSARIFRRAGFEVVAAPCAYRTRDFRGTWQDWLLLNSRAIGVFESAWHEWLSLGWGRITGRF